ncbi:MAG: PEP-CTERM sorting domain-containing protein [Planctomycetaceae bacterium]
MLSSLSPVTTYSVDAAIINEFTSEASWTSAAVSSGGTVTLYDFEDGIVPSEFSTGYAGPPTATDYMPVSGANVFQPTTIVPNAGVVTVNFAQPVNAVGGFFLDVESGFAATGFDFDGDGNLEVAFTSSQGDDSVAFLGFTTDMPITSLRLSLGQVGPIADGVAVDNFQFSTVPEPSCLAVLGIGAIGLIGLHRRKLKRKAS